MNQAFEDKPRDECGIVALADLGHDPLTGERFSEPIDVARMIPGMLLDQQNRGQLAAGMTTYNPAERQLLKTHKDVGSVRAVFRLGDKQAHRDLMDGRSGSIAIGHTRYATCGADDREYAQPFERVHGKTYKWFSFCFNGNVANHRELASHLADDLGYHLIRPDCDTELFLHYIAFQQRGLKPREWGEVFRRLPRIVDGAWSMAMVTAAGDLLVARDPTGLKPLSYGCAGRVLAVASESIALQNLGVRDIKPVPPGTLLHVHDGKIRHIPLGGSHRPSHCFFEWVYFSNVASIIDGASVYQARAEMGRALARIETEQVTRDHIVVPVPDTSKPAGDAFAYQLRIPAIEGLVRNRYSGDRTFIESDDRLAKVKRKFIALRGILEGKKVFLVDDSLVRSTTISFIANYIRTEGGAKEVHVRIACPPIMAPCFYGIDMSSIGELFAPQHLRKPVLRGPLPKEVLARMAASFGADSLQYLPVDQVPRCIGKPGQNLCMACVTRHYPTRCGRIRFEEAVAAHKAGVAGRVTTALPPPMEPPRSR